MSFKQLKLSVYNTKMRTFYLKVFLHTWFFYKWYWMVFFLFDFEQLGRMGIYFERNQAIQNGSLELILDIANMTNIHVFGCIAKEN